MTEEILLPIESLDPFTLQRIIEEFVTREGTDYGVQYASLNEKVADVEKLLRHGKARIYFDPESESCTILMCV